MSSDLAPGQSPRPVQPLTLIQYHGTCAQPTLCRAQETSSTLHFYVKQKTAPYWRDPDPDAPSQRLGPKLPGQVAYPSIRLTV